MSAVEPLPAEPVVVRAGAARLPTEHGEFRVMAYRAADGGEHLAIVAGEPAAGGGRHVLTRLHSECLTGDVLGSQRCDCGPQLARALAAIGGEGRGVVVYLRGHEGRGIGLVNKIRAYELQDDGLDTVDANVAQGLPVDARRYDVAAAILADLGIGSVRLLSNNPAKAEGLAAHGLAVDGLVPIVIPPTADSAGYLGTKRDRLGHDLPD